MRNGFWMLDNSQYRRVELSEVSPMTPGYSSEAVSRWWCRKGTQPSPPKQTGSVEDSGQNS